MNLYHNNNVSHIVLIPTWAHLGGKHQHFHDSKKQLIFLRQKQSHLSSQNALKRYIMKYFMLLNNDKETGA